MLYQRHGYPENTQKTFLQFSQEIAEGLIYANKIETCNRGRPSKKQGTWKERNQETRWFSLKNSDTVKAVTLAATFY